MEQRSIFITRSRTLPPPHWLKRFSHLSNGQKFRCELARCLLLDVETVIFDEFTSVVDRDVAKICSVAIAKSIRRRLRPRFVALSCHYDIIDWLQPDWLYDVSAARFEWRTLRRHPEIRIDVHRCDRRAWTMFREHHYLSHDLNPTARCYVLMWGKKPVAFHATLPWTTQSAAIRTLAQSVLLTPEPQLPPAVDRGQTDVLAAKLTFTLPGAPGESEARIVEFAVAMTTSQQPSSTALPVTTPSRAQVVTKVAIHEAVFPSRKNSLAR
jgi:hypothetical protein